uniref:Plant heme peroxidase family profile domain-containing protein n=1 Tax=Zea mays TaxID=4577 RepID=A0A804QR02_MAIZE
MSQSYYASTCPDLQRGAGDAPPLLPRLLRQSANSDRVCVGIQGTANRALSVCFVKGCDASVLLSGPDDEHSAGADTTLSPDALDLVTRAKAAVDADPRCANRVSCANVVSKGKQHHSKGLKTQAAAPVKKSPAAPSFRPPGAAPPIRPRIRRLELLPA